jgi:endonuclease/exonuclease/phosphatase family metal-dependent hydrolase
MHKESILPVAVLVLAACLSLESAAGQTIRVCTYNLENYLDQPSGGRTVKSAESRAQVRQCLREIKPDLLALQEIGSASALQELKESLKGEGLDLPYSQIAGGADTNIHIAVLSRFQFADCHSWTNLGFVLGGRRFHLSRGFLEADVRISTNRMMTIIAAHLKSRRPVPHSDEQELRVEEAKLLRERIEARLKVEPALNLVVLGDFNDTQDSITMKTILGRGKMKLLDTRPCERLPGDFSTSREPTRKRTVNWTHHYAVEDTYSRIDYILISPALLPDWSVGGTYVLASPAWGLASDHRPIVAAFDFEEP